MCHSLFCMLSLMRLGALADGKRLTTDGFKRCRLEATILVIKGMRYE